MKKIGTKISGLILVIGILIALSGCTCQQNAASDDAVTSVETVSSENVKILWADSRQAEENVVVHGTLRRRAYGSVPMKAHVDVQVLSMNGDILQEVHTPDVYVPRNRPGKGIKFERFEIELQNVSADNKIILTAHQGEHHENV